MAKALVLGGGGVTGIAWMTGVLTGLHGAGVDCTDAELFVGTSAGSVVAAQLATGHALDQLYERQLAMVTDERAARFTPFAMARWMFTMLTTRDPVRYAQKMGAMALGADTPSEAERIAVIESRLPLREWPSRKLLITAVNARTGELQVFDSSSGVRLVDAVAASCAVPGVYPPVTIGSERYVDGGVRSPVNADLAAGCDRVVILAPISSGFGGVPPLGRQVDGLRAGGAQVVVVEPDFASRSAIGRNALDPSRRRPSAQAGFAQAPHVAAAIRALWTQGLKT